LHISHTLQNPYEVDISNYRQTQVNFTTFEPFFWNTEPPTLSRNSSFLDSILAYQGLQTLISAAVTSAVREYDGRGEECSPGTGCSRVIKGTDIRRQLYVSVRTDKII
jgi:hypothetical protein